MSNTLWSPRVRNDDSPIYRAIADALEKDIDNGVLRDGARLPTHRQLASKLGVTPLTITRAYKEASRRGLIDSSVGRGTFVRSASTPLFNSVRMRDQGMVDLAKNIIQGSDVVDLDARALASVRPFLRDAEYAPTEGLLRHRVAAATWLRRSALEVSPDRIVITPGAHQAMLAVLAALVRPGDTILAEEFSYPRFNAIAALLHIKIQPVALDEHGIVPASLEKACRRLSPKALYVIPNFQNPTGSVMPEKRRREIAAIVKRHEIPVIEDDVYGFLLSSPPTPIATLVPELTAFITSSSKSVTPSLRIGIAALAPALVERVTLAFGASTAFTSTVAAELFTQLIESGAAAACVDNKRQIVSTNRHAADRALGPSAITAHPMSPHFFLTIPNSLDAHELADRARMRGIAVAPGSAFAIDRSTPPNAIRISLGAVSDAKQLESAIRTIASLIENPRMGSGAVV
ncbi:MAG: aminotransferase-like domain-containing protein [Thermoanaerobaculia bacterium]